MRRENPPLPSAFCVTGPALPARPGLWSGIVTTSVSVTPRRYLALWFPFLPAERLRRSGGQAGGAPAETPLALVAQAGGAMRLAAVDAAAMALGLLPGLALADALAHLPKLQVLPHDPAADEALMGVILEDAARWTPMIAPDPPLGLMLDITGCAHLFGGEAALRQHVLARLARGGLSVRATIAGTPQAARALARFGNVAIVPPVEAEAAVRPLPVAALELPAETETALRRAGLRLIGDLADRPAQALTARFGPAMIATLRAVLGREDRRITPVRPLPACIVEQPFAEPIGRVEDVGQTLRRLIHRAVTVLQQREQGGRTFEAAFFRSDGVVRSLSVRTGRPSRDAAAILRLFSERFEALEDPLDPGFGFDLIRLGVPVVEPLPAFQDSLDGKALEDDALADLIDRLVARFGPRHVLRLAPVDTHDPLRAERLVPATTPEVYKPAWPVQEPGEPPLRPLRLFDPPQPIEALAEVPDGPPLRFRWRRVLHRIARAEGPERIAPEWWRDPLAPTRDYYRVEDEAGRRFWLFRAGLYDRETAQPRWYLHGLFA